MNNIHINMNEFTNASRVLKQTRSLTESEMFENVVIIALAANGLPEFEQLSEKVSLYRIKLLTRKLPKSLFFQVFKYIEFFFKTLFFISKAKAEVVNVHALSLLPIGVVSKLIFKNSLVYDAHELETEVVGLFGVRKKISKFFERILIKYTDMIIVVSESIADWYLNEYSIQRPLVVLNAPNKRELKINNHFRDELGIRNDQKILLYQGGLYSGRGVNFILDAFQARLNDDLVIVFMGKGELMSKIKKVSEQKNNIFFYPAVSPDVVLEYTASADIGIHLIQNNCLNHNYCMPNKLFEYAMAGLPILVSNVKDMSELVVKSNMGLMVGDFSVLGINTAIDDFLQRDLIQMKHNSYRTATNNSWEIQETKMLRGYQIMLNGRITQ